MTSDKILNTLDAIAATASKNDKEAMVREAAQDAVFRRVLSYAYDPFKTYGLRQIPERSAGMYGGSDVDNEFDGPTWTLLDGLAKREITGNAARQAVQDMINWLTEPSADLFVRIIRKDLRAGFSESTCNKAVKGLIPEFPYQRCCLPKDASLVKWPWQDGVFSQEKADGMFANVDHEVGGLVSIRSRQGTEFPMDKFVEVADEIRARLAPGHQQHGEFLVLRDGVVCARQDGNGVLNSVLNGGDFAPNEKPIFMVWDQIPLSAVVKKGKHETPYTTRLAGIVRQLRETPGGVVKLIPTKVVKSLAEAYSHAGELMKKGKEGTIVKHPKAIWKDGTSKEQVKIKLEFEVDLKVVAIVPGNAGTKNEGRAGSLSCRTSDGLLQVDVTVKNEAMRDLVDANPDDWIGRIIPVTANDIMLPSESNDKHSLFLPRMTEAAYRTDKVEADSLERVKAQKDAAIFGEKLKEAA